MLHVSSSRLRVRSLLIAAAACLAIPASADALTITSVKAGPVPTYHNPLGLGFIPSSAANPATTPATPANPGSFDTTCAYGTPNPFVPSPLDPSGQTNALPNYNTDSPDVPLTLNSQAGANTDFCVAFRLGMAGNAVSGEDLKNTRVQLPVGSLAEIDTQTHCSDAAFARESIEPNTCPPASQVGSSATRLQVPTGLPSPLPQFALRDAPGRVFAIETPSNLAARLGVVLVGAKKAGGVLPVESKFLIDVSQEGTATIGLINQTDSLANTTVNNGTPIPMQVQATSLRFWGKASEHVTVGGTKMASNFFRVGTTCQTDQVVKLTANPYVAGDAGVAAGYENSASASADAAAYKLTGCDALPFNPTFTAALTGETNPGGHPGLQIDIKSPEGDEDLGATTITLPQGVATDLSRIQNACPQATFFARGCTPAQIIGRVSATLSGINADVPKGDIYMVKVDGETLPALGLDFQGRLPLRLAGVSKINSTGRIANTFSALPSIPQRSLSVTLFGADNGILQMEPGTKCTTSAYDATLTGQNGKSKSFALPTLCKEQFVASLSKSNKTTPTLSFSGAGATGKKIQSIKLGLPGGLTVNKNRSKTGYKVDKLESTITKKLSANRLNSKTIRLTVPKPGSSGLRILTRTKTLKASNKFRKAKTAVTVTARVVYQDGTKATVAVPLTRK